MFKLLNYLIKKFVLLNSKNANFSKFYYFNKGLDFTIFPDVLNKRSLSQEAHGIL